MTDTVPIISLNRRAADRVRHGYPWVFRSDTDDFNTLGGLDLGQLVHFADPHKKILATGYAHPKAQLMGRVLAMGQTSISTDFFVQRFAAACMWRETLFGDKPFYRWVHAESDFLPGLIVDRFGETVIVQVNTAGMEALQGLWLPALQATPDITTIILKNDSTGRATENLPENYSVVLGQAPQQDRVVLEENGVSFYADIKNGQKTGWFYDHRPHRAWVAHLARGKKLADIFSHTGGFGITAARHGASHVVCVDSSDTALALVKDNAVLNACADRVTTEAGKAFDVLETWHAEKRRFDIVCVDPPAFVKTKKDMAVGLKGYEKLAKLSALLVNEGGILFYASCSSHPTEDDILNAVIRGAGAAGKKVALIYKGTAGPDHPMHPQLPETRYLKALAFRVTS